jgi:hypothetical protein
MNTDHPTESGDKKRAQLIVVGTCFDKARPSTTTGGLRPFLFGHPKRTLHIFSKKKKTYPSHASCSPARWAREQDQVRCTQSGLYYV